MKYLIFGFLLSVSSSYGATGMDALPETNLSNEAYPTGGLLKRRSNDMGGKDLLTTEQTSSEKQEISGEPQTAKKALDMKDGYVDPVSDFPAHEVFDAALSQGKTQTGPYDTTTPQIQAEEAPEE
jgi:hypothetical protein